MNVYVPQSACEYTHWSSGKEWAQSVVERQGEKI